MTAFKLRRVVYICENFWKNVITSDKNSLDKIGKSCDIYSRMIYTEQSHVTVNIVHLLFVIDMATYLKTIDSNLNEITVRFHDIKSRICILKNEFVTF